MSIAASSLRVRFPVEYSTANPGRPAAACRRLSWTFLPFSTFETRKSTCCGDSTHPLCAARRVSLPSRRLTPSVPVPAFFRAGGALGLYPSKRSPLERASSAFPPRLTRLPFLSPIPPTLARRPVSSSRGSRAFTRSRVPDEQRVISAPPAGCSLGVRSLPGLSRNSLERDSSRPPLARFSEPRTNALFGGVSECQSALAWSFPDMPEHRQLRIRQPS